MGIQARVRGSVGERKKEQALYLKVEEGENERERSQEGGWTLVAWEWEHAHIPVPIFHVPEMRTFREQERFGNKNIPIPTL